MTMSGTILIGDALEQLRALPDCSVHCCVTSPPYWGLRDYGCEGQMGLEPTPDAYVQRMVEVFGEVRRVLRDDGTLWLNCGDSYSGYHGNSKCADAEAPSNKPGYVENMRETTVGVDGLKPKDLCMIPARLALALQANGWYLRSDIVWAKPNPMPESVTDRPTKSHEHVFMLSKQPRYYWDQEAVREPLSTSSIKRLSQRTFDQQTGGPKDYGHRTNSNRSARKALRNLRERMVAQEKWDDRHAGYADRKPAIGRNIRDVWTIATEPCREAHFAVMPQKLVEPCIKAGTSERGCCPECGAPWERVVENAPDNTGYPNGPGGSKARDTRGNGASGKSTLASVARYQTTTIGWRPTCKCAVIACADCCKVIEWAHYDNTTTMHNSDLPDLPDGLRAGQAWKEVLQQAVLQEIAENAPRPHLPTVREDIQADGVKTESMQQGMRDGGAAEWQKCHSQGVHDHKQGIQDAVLADSPKCDQRRLCDGASCSSREPDRKATDWGGDSPPQKQGQTRQSDREPADYASELPQQGTEGTTNRDLSSLRRTLPSKGACPHCGGHTVTVPPPPCASVVLDPFFGAGTVGLVAERLGRNWLGIELNPEYAEIARRRIANPEPAPVVEPDPQDQLRLEV